MATRSTSASKSIVSNPSSMISIWKRSSGVILASMSSAYGGNPKTFDFFAMFGPQAGFMRKIRFIRKMHFKLWGRSDEIWWITFLANTLFDKNFLLHGLRIRKAVLYVKEIWLNIPVKLVFIRC